MILFNKIASIQIIVFTCFTITVSSQQFEGVITHKQIETNNSVLNTLINMQQRPGSIERYMNKNIKVYIAGDTLICERFDSIGVLINTSLQIGDLIYTRSNYSEPVFKNFSHYSPSICKIENWKKIRGPQKSNFLIDLSYYIGSEATNPNQTIEIGVKAERNAKYSYNKNGFFQCYFTKEGVIYYECLKYKELIKVRSDYHYEMKEISLLCKQKIEEYYIEY